MSNAPQKRLMLVVQIGLVIAGVILILIVMWR
jgi:hypothetical protein